MSLPPPLLDAPGLDAARALIDQADHELIRLLARRFEAVRQVARIKASQDGTVLLDPGRELRIQDAWLREAESLGLPVPFARRLLRRVLA